MKRIAGFEYPFHDESSELSCNLPVRRLIARRIVAAPVHDDLQLIARAHQGREARDEHSGHERIARDDAQASGHDA